MPSWDPASSTVSSVELRRAARAERLVGHRLGIERHIGKHGRLEEVRAEFRAGPAAGEDARAPGGRIVDVVPNPVELPGRGQGPDRKC